MQIINFITLSLANAQKLKRSHMRVHYHVIYSFDISYKTGNGFLAKTGIISTICILQPGNKT